MTLSVTPDDRFFRRILDFHVLPRRVSSSAFKKRSSASNKKVPDDRCSVYLESLMESPGEPLNKAIAGQWLGAFSAGVVIDLAIEVHKDDEDEAEEPSHCELGIQSNDQAEQLAAACRLVEPEAPYNRYLPKPWKPE